MPLPAGEAGPSAPNNPYSQTSPAPGTQPFVGPIRPGTERPYVPAPNIPTYSEVPQTVVEMFQPPAAVIEANMQPIIDFDSLFTEEQQKEMKQSVDERSRAERLEARAERVLGRRGIDPMIQGYSGASVQGMPISTPQTNPMYEVEKAELLQRWDRRRALSPDQAGGRRDEKEPGQQKRERPEVTPMTWDEYNALSDAERAAIDFNGMLVQAVRKDKRLNRTGGYDDIGEEERATYDRTVEKLLGEDSGSRLYAPETVAMLQQIDIPDAAGDLDDFLKLKVAITDKDLKRISAWEENVANPSTDETGRGDYELAPTEALEDRTQLQLELADATVDLQAALAEGNQFLATWRQTAKMARNEDLEFYGGVPNEAKVPIGFEPPQFIDGIPQNAAGYFQAQFEALANAEGDQAWMNQVLADTRAALEPLGQLQDFYNYLDIKSRQAVQQGDYLNKNPQIQYRSPEEFRKLLGYGE